MYERQKISDGSIGLGHPEPRGLLYHYTTLDGLIGILEHDNIYATHIKYMNDSKEFIDILDHMDHFVKVFNPSLHLHLRPFFSSVKNIFDGIYGAYVVSFTDDDEAKLFSPEVISGDRLSQWRAYSNNGKGFSLGFDHKNMLGFDKIDTILNCYAILSYCAYTEIQKRELFEGSAKMYNEYNDTEMKKLVSAISSTFDQIFDEMRRAKDNKDKTDHLESIIQHRLMLTITYFCVAAFCKHHAYSEEKEWRIVLIPLPNNKQEKDKNSESLIPVKFRKGITGITPYIEVPLGLRNPLSSLRKIVIGPTPNMRQSIIALEMLLENKGIKVKSKDYPRGVEVVSSQIPYRN